MMRAASQDPPLRSTPPGNCEQPERSTEPAIVTAIVLTLFFGAIAYRWAPAPLPIAATLLMVMAVAAFVRPGDRRLRNPAVRPDRRRRDVELVALHERVLAARVDLLSSRLAPDHTDRAGAGLCLLRPSNPQAGRPHLVIQTRQAVRTHRSSSARFVVLATMRGLLAGGNTTVVLLQVRPLVYCIALYILITNEFSSARQYRIAFALALVATVIQSIFTLDYYRHLPLSGASGSSRWASTRAPSS